MNDQSTNALDAEQILIPTDGSDKSQLDHTVRVLRTALAEDDLQYMSAFRTRQRVAIFNLHTRKLKSKGLTFIDSVKLAARRHLLYTTRRDVLCTLMLFAVLFPAFQIYYGIGNLNGLELAYLVVDRILFGSFAGWIAFGLIYIPLEMRPHAFDTNRNVLLALIPGILILWPIGMLVSLFPSSLLVSGWDFSIGGLIVLPLWHTGISLMVVARGGLKAHYPYFLKHMATPEIIEDMSPEKRGRLVLLQALGKHVRVVTTHGEIEKRMTLKEAMEIAAPIQGRQIHRSFWVADAYLSPPYRDQRKYWMKVHEHVLPVSEAAGLEVFDGSFS